MTNLDTSLKLVSSLSRAAGVVWTNANKRKAPHKPLLLLAVRWTKRSGPRKSISPSIGGNGGCSG